MDGRPDPAAGLPHGTLTLVFTDIEGSTRLLTRLGDDYGRLLADHRRLLRAAFAAHDGHELGTEGDSCFVAFARARDAVAAVIDAQRALAGHGWPAGAAVRVRVGIHSSEPAAGPESLVGIGVHRAARICAAAHGGQVLVSSATAELLDDVPAAATLRDLGEHRLKDLERPQRLFQLVVSGLPADFPPPRALPAEHDEGLPPVATPTVGREAELEALAAELRTPGVRLLTLTGPGGVGKSRLAVEAARRVAAGLDGGARFVALAPVAGAPDVAPAVARALGVAVREGEPDEDAVVRHLADREVLLVLDNFEHVLEAAPLVGRLLAACPHVRVLVTSRAPIRLAAERLHPVRPLEVPSAAGAADGLEAVPAVALFCERARAREPGFVLDERTAPHVAEVCRRLDGLPLALELAAARIGILSPPELATRLGRALDVLVGGAADAPARQRTVRATIDWSFALLEPAERAAFARLAAVPAGATLAEAEAVTGATLDTLESLLAKQLIVRRGDRLAMLQVVREYGAERLAEDPEADAVHRRLADWCAQVARATTPQLGQAGHRDVVAVLVAELPNAQAALAWALERGDAATATRLAAAWAPYWWRLEHWAEAGRWLDAVLACEDAPPSLDRAAVLLHRARVVSRFEAGGPQDARRLALVHEALELYRAAGDADGEAACLSHLAQAASYQGLDSADGLGREALAAARRSGRDVTMALVLAETAGAAGDRDAVLERAQAALPYLERVGSLHDLARLANLGGFVAMSAGRYADALGWLERAIEAGRRMGHPWTEFVVRNNLGLTRLFLGDLDGAAEDLGAALGACRIAGAEIIVDETLVGTAALATRRGDAERAARIAGAAHRHESPFRSVEERHMWRRLHDEFLEPARRDAGDARWDALERDGARLTLHEAIDLALAATAAPQNTGVSR